MRRALEGILVVSLGQAVAAPYATQRLADGGARVIKVEREGGDFARHYDTVAKGECSFFVWLNRGAESIVLDLKDPRDVALLRRMLARADVFIQNLAPGALDRLGLASPMLRAEFPRLITCDISGYGYEGPNRNMKAYDLLIQAESGLASLTGSPAEAGRVGVSICDLTAGMNAHAAILEALIARGVTGQGSAIHVSMFDGLADMMNTALMQQRYTGKAPARIGFGHSQVVPYGLFKTADGEIVIAIQNAREWENFCATVLLRPEIAAHADFRSNEARAQNREALYRIIDEVFGGLSLAALSARLEAANIAFGRLNSVADLQAHPQLRTMMQPTPSGDVEVIASAIRFAGPSAPPRPTPALGQHTDAIRREFG
ncbi:MAG TPA: CaiB/BaiF CoA-transferase family protein [Alphaproteobacteria bacterium]|nr:CaiB/BaiF CoA-transferase family protein [Alphaproteobacteria bacterium]